MDLIDRQAAIDEIGEKADEIYKTKQKGATYPHDDFFQGMAYAEDVVRQLPSAEPVRMKGWWRDITASDCSGYDPTLAGYDDPVVGYVCSNCGDGYEKEVMGEVMWNFCPNCGADMRGEDDG